MKTKVTAAPNVRAGRLARATAAWSRFWFTPADPTVLGLIRISCGLVIFYTFFAYTFDLDALLGKDAWLDLPLRQAMAHDAPVMRPSTSWSDPQRLAMPQEPGFRQKYWQDYYKKWSALPPPPWPKDQAEADRIDKYILTWGTDPRMNVRTGHPYWSIYFHVTDPTAMMAVHVGILVVCFLFVIGFCTRVTSVLTWFAALSYIHRAAICLFGVDAMIIILLTYLAIGPSGAALSVDRLIARWWSRARPRVIARWRAFWAKGEPAEPVAPGTFSETPAPSISANVAIRLLQIHMCFIYASAGLSKLLGPSWWTGTAVWGTIANFEYAPLQYDWYLGVLAFVARHKWLFELTMTTAGMFTLFFEIGYAFLIWRPSTRWLMLGMAITLHGFIGIFMGLKTFSLIMLTMNLAFVPPETIRWFVRRLTGSWARPGTGALAPALELGIAGKPVASQPDKEEQPVAGSSIKRGA